MQKKVKITQALFDENPGKVTSFEITRYIETQRQQLLLVWEKSVLATHHFLSDEDFKEIKAIVSMIDFTALNVFCLMINERLEGFIGIAGKKVEMLFLSPEFTGKKLGKKLVEFAINELNADEVDVNEQNTIAVTFYKKLGFEVYERTEKDGLGMNYPILKLKLKYTQRSLS